jgi:2-methylcitrate dehydratase PrpD
MTPVADALIAFAQNVSLDAMSAQARTQARLVLLDAMGAALAARPHRIGEIVCAHARAMGGPSEAGLIGGGRASALAAAYANGALANAADFDEGSHVATFALPAALAMAQRQRASGADFLTAFVTAFEAGSRLKDSIDARGGAQSLAARGFWSIGIIGPVASALACARLLRLDEDRTRAALSLAACAGGGLRLQLGAFAKALHSGQAARAGLEAALLAQAGARGDPRALDHAQGLLSAFAGPNAPDYAPFDAMGAGALVLDAPTKIKAMPVCTPIAPALDAAIALAQAHDLRAQDIARVEVDFQTHSLFRDLPPDEESAPFCAPYLVAAALVRRRVTLDETSGKALRDREILTLAARVRHEPGASLVVTTADGRRLEQTLGAVRRLVAQDEIVAKFDACASHALEPSAAQNLRARLLDVESLADVSDL